MTVIRGLSVMSLAALVIAGANGATARPSDTLNHNADRGEVRHVDVLAELGGGSETAPAKAND